MKSKLFIFLLAVVAGSFMGIVNGYGAYQIDWMYVQHRVYEDGTSYNRVAFGLIDEANNRNLPKDVVTNIELLGPGGTPVSLEGSLGFYSIDYMVYGYYDAYNGYWVFPDPSTESGWYDEILSSLLEGEYTLKVTTSDGQTLVKTYTFNQQIDLPIVSKRSFRFEKKDGNIWWRWDTPMELYTMNPSVATQCRAYIDIYRSGNLFGELSFRVPTHMGGIFLPSQVVEELKTLGDQFDLVVQIRTNDNNNRSYSSPLTIR